MKKKRHSESEMVKAVRDYESGVSAEVVAREHGVSATTLYNWKSKYSGMDVSQVRRLREYEVSITRACRMMEIHRSYFYYREKKDDNEVEEAIRSAAEHGDGFWKIFGRLRRAGRGTTRRCTASTSGCTTRSVPG